MADNTQTTTSAVPSVAINPIAVKRVCSQANMQHSRHTVSYPTREPDCPALGFWTQSSASPGSQGESVGSAAAPFDPTAHESRIHTKFHTGESVLAVHGDVANIARPHIDVSQVSSFTCPLRISQRLYLAPLLEISNLL